MIIMKFPVIPSEVEGSVSYAGTAICTELLNLIFQEFPQLSLLNTT